MKSWLLEKELLPRWEQHSIVRSDSVEGKKQNTLKFQYRTKSRAISLYKSSYRSLEETKNLIFGYFKVFKNNNSLKNVCNLCSVSLKCFLIKGTAMLTKNHCALRLIFLNVHFSF